MSTNRKPLFAFFGTPAFAVEVLNALEKNGLLPAIIVTSPDRPQGRGLPMRPSAVRAWAAERGISVLTPISLSDETFLAELQNNDWDVFVVAAYTKLIPKMILDMPRRGCLNVHPSLLPKFRGPSPVLSAILADERATGVTIMHMDKELDHGPIVAQARVELEEDAWPPKGSLLEELLATEGGNLLAEVLPDWLKETIPEQPQDESAATFTKKFTSDDARVDLAGNPRQNFLKIRAFDKNPRAYFITPANKRVIITGAEFVNGQLLITRVIPEGKKEMLYEEFARTYL